MATYNFSGKMRMGKEIQSFQKEIEAESEKHAKQKLFSELGSEHGVSRGRVEVD